MDEDPAGLVRAAAAGDQLAWDTLVDRFAGLLWSIGFGYRLSRSDAADVFQTTWLRLLEHVHTIKDPSRIGGWLATTYRREAMATLRRAGRVLPTEDDADLDVGGEALPGVDLPLLRGERDGALWTAFSKLTLRCQQVLRTLVADAEEGPPHYPDVAAALGMPVGSLGPTRARCLSHLRRLLGEHGIYGLEPDS